jgi:hypothetical protein
VESTIVYSNHSRECHVVDDATNATDPPILFCARLIACVDIRTDPSDADAGFSLERILVHVRPPDGGGFPFRAARIFLFAQLHGTPGKYNLWVRQIRINGGKASDGPDAVEVLGAIVYGSKEITLSGRNYVECYGIPLEGVYFAQPGVYEFQLWADGFSAMLMNERIEARE